MARREARKRKGLNSAARQRAAILMAALPALALSAQFAHVLFAPLAWNNRQWAADALTLMGLEFVMVHAGFASLFAMSGTRARRIAAAVVIGAGYLLFIVTFGLLFGQPAMMLAAAVLLAGRLAGAAAGGPAELTERAGVSAFSAVLYLGVVVGSAASASFPAFGFTPEVLRELRPLLGDGRGLWEAQPQRLVAAVAVYFLGQGLLELARLRHVREAPVGEAWIRIGHIDVRMLPDAVELRSSGEPGALLFGSMMGGVPLLLGVALFAGGDGVAALFGALLAAAGAAFAALMGWKSTRKVAVRAAPNRLEIRETLLWTGPRERRFGAAELERLDLSNYSGANNQPAIYKLVLRLPQETIILGAGLDSGQGYELIGLIKSRVRGS